MSEDQANFCQTSVAERVMHTLALAQRNNWIASIEGPPGVGKSTAAIRYAQENGRRVWYYAARRDTAAKGPLFRDLAVRFTGFKDVQTRENVTSLKMEAERRNSSVGPVLLILDEAQNLNADTLETIRAIHDEDVLALALVGNHTFTDRFNTERQSLAASPQFLSRLDLTCRLSAVAPDDAAAVARAHGVPEAMIGKLSKVAGGLKGLRIMETVSRLAADLAAGAPPSRADFEAAITVLCD
jgi:hypothetical protein